jgi:hypothetical protein
MISESAVDVNYIWLSETNVGPTLFNTQYAVLTHAPTALDMIPAINLNGVPLVYGAWNSGQPYELKRASATQTVIRRNALTAYSLEFIGAIPDPQILNVEFAGAPNTTQPTIYVYFDQDMDPNTITTNNLALLFQ